MNTARTNRIHQLIYAMLKQYNVKSIECLTIAMDIDRLLTFCTREEEEPYKHVANAIFRGVRFVLPLTVNMVAACVIEYERQRSGEKLVGS